MDDKRIELELSAELYNELARIARELGIARLEDAALIGLTDWIERRKAELDDRDPEQRYFINEALEHLAERKK